MKTFDKKDIYSWVNAEEAKAYIGKEGYFSNYCLNNLVEWYKGTLSKINSSTDCRITHMFINDKREIFGLFIPLDKVKEVEEPKKRWRAFKSIDEFKKETGLDLLSIVHYRFSPSSTPRIITSTGYGVITDFLTCSNFITSSDKPYYVTIGDTSFNLDELFNYEYFADNEWKPFGVAEE